MRGITDARLAVIAEAKRVRLLILELLGKRPGMSVIELSGEVGLTVGQTKNRLALLVVDEQVHSVLVTDGQTSFFARYYLGPHPEGGRKRKEEVQRTVNEWKPPTIKHDPLHTAFFGAKQQQGE